MTAFPCGNKKTRHRSDGRYSKTSYLPMQPGIGQSIFFGQSFLAHLAAHVFLWCSFPGVFTPPAKTAVESNDMARSEKNSFFILLI